MKGPETMYIQNSYNNKKTAVFLVTETYILNNQIAVLLYDAKSGEYYSDLSVFVEPFEKENYMAVDVNNLPMAEEFIQRYNLGKLVGYTYSGFVSYPVYAMNMEELKKRDTPMG